MSTSAIESQASSSASSKSSNSRFRVNWKSRKGRASSPMKVNQSKQHSYTTTVPVSEQYKQPFGSDQELSDGHLNEASPYFADPVEYPNPPESLDSQYSKAYEPETGAMCITYPSEMIGVDDDIRELEYTETESEMEDYTSIFGPNPLLVARSGNRSIESRGSMTEYQHMTEYQQFEEWLNQEYDLDDFEDSYEEFVMWKKWKSKDL